MKFNYLAIVKKERFRLLIWGFATGIIFLGSLLSMIFGGNFPPFSSYPMYSRPILQDELIIYRVVPVGTNDPTVHKRIIDINTNRTLTTILSKALKEGVSHEVLGREILKHYRYKLSEDSQGQDFPFMLRLERIDYQFSDLRNHVDEISKAQNWNEMDRIMSGRRWVMYEE